MGVLTEAEVPPTVPWVPQAFPYINPKQDIEAAEAEIRVGLSSRSKKASERGEDSAEIDQQQADDNARADRLKLKYDRSEEHTSELQSLMRISYAVFCLKKKKKK